MTDRPLLYYSTQSRRAPKLKAFFQWSRAMFVELILTREEIFCL